MRRHISTAIALLLLVAGCSSGASNVEAIEGDDGANAPPVEESSTARTPDGGDAAADADDGDAGDPGVENPPEPDDPFAVPDEIDEAYVERVLNEIYAVNSDVVRRSLEVPVSPTASPSGEQLRAIEAITAPRTRPDFIESQQDLLRYEQARETQLPLEDFGVQRFEVDDLPRVAEGCVTVVGWYDLTETAREPFERDQLVTLVLSRDETVDLGVNKAGWRLWDLNTLRTEEGWIDADEVTLDSLEAVMDVTCSQ